LIAASVAVVALLRHGGYTRFEASTFITKPLGPQRPSDQGVAYEAISIASGDRSLAAWWVPGDEARAAVLVWHGQNEALSDWTHAISACMTSVCRSWCSITPGTGRAPADRAWSVSAKTQRRQSQPSIGALETGRAICSATRWARP